MCPRNCLDSCPIIATVKDGILIRTEGDPACTYTKGTLCAKGYAYPLLVNSPARLKYPLLQVPRNSGNWQRISWDEAIDLIAASILKVREKNGDLLSFCLNRQGGNMGILHNAMEGLLRSLGGLTLVKGDSCFPAAQDAQMYDMGASIISDPEELDQAKLVVIWGFNPAITAPHLFTILESAREKGAKIIVVDPILTATAAKADLHIRPKFATDGALALGIGRLLLEKDLIDFDFMRENVMGWEKLRTYLLNEVTLNWASEISGVSFSLIEKLAFEIGQNKPVAFLPGMGLQRHANGGQNFRAVEMLAALTGNIGKRGGGVYFAGIDSTLINCFNYHILSFKPSFSAPKVRFMEINDFAGELKKMDNPPVEILWFAGRNALSQDSASLFLNQTLKKIPLIVTTDLFLTSTARISDLVLPVKSFFEEWDAVASIWHNWVGINRPVLNPIGECKTDLEIAQLIAKRIGELEQKTPLFPAEESSKELLAAEMEGRMFELLGINSVEELIEGPKQAKNRPVAWADGLFKTPSAKYELYSQKAKQNGLPSIPRYVKPFQPLPSFPFRFLTPHSWEYCNSQFLNLDLSKSSAYPRLLVSPPDAQKLGIYEKKAVRIYNEWGSAVFSAKISKNVPPGILISYAKKDCRGKDLSRLISPLRCDMGKVANGSRGQAFYDTFVNIGA